MEELTLNQSLVKTLPSVGRERESFLNGAGLDYHSPTLTYSIPKGSFP
jgi:hypothetical protein